MTVAAFLALAPAAQNAEVARWLGWVQDTRGVPVYWRHAGSGERLCSPPPFVSGGWPEFGAMWEALPRDGKYWWQFNEEHLPPYFYEVRGSARTNATCDIECAETTANLALALALGKGLGKLTEK